MLETLHGVEMAPARPGMFGAAAHVECARPHGGSRALYATASAGTSWECAGCGTLYDAPWVIVRQRDAILTAARREAAEIADALAEGQALTTADLRAWRGDRDQDRWETLYRAIVASMERRRLTLRLVDAAAGTYRVEAP